MPAYAPVSATTLSTILPPSILALSIADAEAAIRDTATRASIKQLMRDGISGWENVSLDPGWDGIVISRSGARPAWNGRSVRAIADELGGDPADHALNVLADDRLSTDIVIHCMAEPDVEAILTRGSLSPRQRDLASAIFRKVAMAESAARAGAQAISDDAVRSGSAVILNGPAAEDAACAFLGRAGQPCGNGTFVSTDGNEVTVTVRSSVDPLLLPVGAQTFTVDRSACVVRGITEVSSGC